MIIRTHDIPGRRSRAVYSDCQRYRYLLSRDWGVGGRLAYVRLNPSTATEVQNDPTIERCERRARALGFGGFAVANIFGYRATDPRDLKQAADPIGPDNDAVLINTVRGADLVICGWGFHGAHQGRGAAVEAFLRDHGIPISHLGLTRGGDPRHPLYIAYAEPPQPWLQG